MKKYFLIALSVLIAFSFSSCLKDKNVENQVYGIEGIEAVNLIEFPSAPSRVFSFDASEVDTTFNLVNVHLNSEVPAAKDITVTIALDQVVLDSFNSQNGKDYIMPPSSLYTFDNLTVTIPKGSRDGYLKLTTKTANLAAAPYAFAFSIVSISDASLIKSLNYKTMVTVVGVKNKYDGRYMLRGHHNRPGLDFPYEAEMYLITNGANEVYFFWPEANSAGHPIGVGPGNALSWYGPAIGPSIIFDPVTNLVEDVYNRGGATLITEYTGPGSRVSKFDPATHNITVDFNYGGNPARAFFDDLTYLGPRP